MDFRIEKDTMGEVKVPAGVYWGAQTQRSIENFRIAQDINKMPKEIIKAFAYLKKAPALTNAKYGSLPANKKGIQTNSRRLCTDIKGNNHKTAINPAMNDAVFLLGDKRSESR